MKNTGIKLLSVLFLCAVLSLLPVLFSGAAIPTTVDSGFCGAEGDGSNLTWDLNSNNVLTIGGEGGAMAQYAVGERPWDPYADRIKVILFDYTPREVDISDYAFAYNFTKVSSVGLGKSVHRIGSYAFAGCTGMKTTLYVEASIIGEGAYEGLTGISRVDLDEKVSEIEAGAFRSCTALQRVDIKGQISALPDHMFENCSVIRSMLLPSSLSEISSTAITSEAFAHVFYGGDASDWAQIAGADAPVFAGAAKHYNVNQWGFCGGEGDGTNLWWTYCEASNVLSFGGTGRMKNFAVAYSDFYTFLRSGCLKSVVFEEGVENVGDYVLYDSCHMNYNTHADFTVTFGSTVTSIGREAFSGCEGITQITIPDTVQSIGPYAFWCCESLQHVTLPAGLTRIERMTFANCPALSEIDLPESITVIDSGAFEMCSSLTSVTLPEGLQTIGEEAFRSCKALEHVTVPDNVTSLGRCSFGYCDMLQSITIGAGVTEIPPYCFRQCARLAEVQLPQEISAIGERAFDECTQLRRLVLPSTVETIYGKAFFYCCMLQDIFIPQSVTEIGDDAFLSCFMLEDVYYGGSPDTWGQIAVGENNGALAKAAVHCNCAVGADLPALDDVLAWGECGSTHPGFPTRNCAEFGNMMWRLSTDGTLRISGEGTMIDMNNLYPRESPWKAYAGSIKNVIVTSGVENVSTNMLASLSSLQHVYLSDTVRQINQNFQYCPALLSYTVDENNPYYSTDAAGCLLNGNKTEFIRYPQGRSGTAYTVPDGVVTISYNAFLQCSALSEIVLPEGLELIGAYAFYYCTALESINIPASVQTVAAYSFTGCSALSGVNITDLKAWNRISFQSMNPLTYAHNLYMNGEPVTDLDALYGETQIGNEAFRGWNAVDITIPETVTRIGKYAFQECTALQCAVIPDSVTEIGENVFYGCSSLTDVTLSAGMTEIGACMFANCESLPQITVPQGVVKIGYAAFTGCRALAEVQLPYGITEIGNYAFYGCTSLACIELPVSLTKIGSSAFYSCENISRIVIPDGIVSIGSGAFYKCTGLQSIAIPEGVEMLDYNTFTYCSALTDVSIPVSLTRINSSAFFGCSSLQYVFYAGTEAQWQDIYIGISNTPLQNANIHYGSTGHTPGEPIYENEIPATCTEPGSYDLVTYCTVCGDVVTSEHVYEPALGHTFESEITLAPTCTEPGVRTYTCVRCPESYTEAEPALGHGTLDYDVSGAPSTCIVRGYSMTVCLACGEITDYEELPLDPTNHNWGEWVLVTPATYLSEGLEQRTCAWCGETETNVLPALVPEETISDPETGIELHLQEGVLPENTVFEVDEEFDGTYFRLLNREVGNVSSTLYNITPMADGSKVQPDGYVLVRLPIPAGYNPDALSIYYISTETGVTERMECYIEDGYICFQTTHFSVYAIVDASAPAQTQTEQPTPGNGNSGSFFARLADWFRNIISLFKNLFKR